MSFRQQAILRELNLYPLWRLRPGVAVQLNTAPGVPVAESATDHRPAISTPLALVTENPDRARIDATSHLIQTSEDGNWPELKGEVNNCTACRLRAGCRQSVFGVGDEKADWLFVGDGPGEEEDTQGEPFVGQGGQLLDNMLAAIKLKRGVNVYIANIVKCRPPEDRAPQPDEIARCMPYLARQIQFIQPRLIIALGKAPALTLLGCDESLENLRGKVHDYRGTPLIVTYHPDDLLRLPADKAKVWQDLGLAVATMATIGN